MTCGEDWKTRPGSYIKQIAGGKNLFLFLFFFYWCAIMFFLRFVTRKIAVICDYEYSYDSLGICCT